MLFRLLGPLRFIPNDHPVDLGAPLQKAVLTTMLVRPGFMVSVPQLMQNLWGAHPPATGVKNIQGYVHRLRRLLGAAPEVVLRTVGGGYVLDVDPHQIDVHRFRLLVETAGRGEPDEADRLLGQALALWTGPALADVRSTELLSVAEQLDAERLNAVEAQAQAQLDTGRPSETVSTLTQLVRGHPLRERGRGLLMLALYLSGRHAEALAVYREGREVLARELGIEPDPVLSLLHEQILRRDPVLDGPGASEVPAPPRQRRPRTGSTGPGLIGRHAELAQLDAVAAGTSAPRLAVIDGLGGVGKTALALHWAEQSRADYPDGVAYVDLRGFDPAQPPLTTGEILSRLLAGLLTASVPEPADTALRLAHWHRLVESRRCLVVLDNAASADQVRELLPRTRTPMTVVTSRHDLTGLVATHGAYRISLSVLATAEATALLSSVLTPERVNRDAAAAARVAASCGHLPLALHADPVRTAPALPPEPVTDGADPRRCGAEADAITVHSRSVLWDRHVDEGYVGVHLGVVELRYSVRQRVAWARFSGTRAFDHLTTTRRVDITLEVRRVEDAALQSYRCRYVFDVHWGDVLATAGATLFASATIDFDGATVGVGHTDRLRLP